VVIVPSRSDRTTTFAEANAALKFRSQEGLRFAASISPPALRYGSSRGQSRTVALVPFAGARKVYGFTGAVMGKLK